MGVNNNLLWTTIDYVTLYIKNRCFHTVWPERGRVRVLGARRDNGARAQWLTTWPVALAFLYGIELT